MILTCPECASRYFIDDHLIGPFGRTVRCQSCGASWRASLEDQPIELTASPEEGALATPPRAPEPEAQSVALDSLPAERLPGAFRARADERRRLREAAAAGAIWAGIAAVLILVAVCLFVFRVDIVRLWPKAATAYAAIGLPVNTTGIMIEKVEAQPGLQDGRAAVIVTGALRNIHKTSVLAPSIRINLLNADGKTVQGKIAAPGDARIPAGETRHFTVTLLDPPSSATDVEVVFETTKAPPPPRRPAEGSSAPMPPLREAPGPPPPPTPAQAPAASAAAPVGAIEEARPIDGDDPFALPAIAGGSAAPASDE